MSTFEVGGALQDHIDDTSDAHNASAISVLDTNGDYTATDVEGVLAEIAPQLGGGGGATDGWTDDTAATWTYASATTFTVSGDQTAKFSKGTRIKLTQTTVKYFVVVASSYSSPNTTVTVAAGSDYSLANASITDNYYSYQINPQGYPDWFNWSPSYTGFSSDPSGATARFRVQGRSCTIKWAHGTPGTSNSGSFTISLPVASALDVSGWMGARAYNNNAFQTGPALITLAAASSTMTMLKDGTGSSWTASQGKSVWIDSFTYEI